MIPTKQHQEICVDFCVFFFTFLHLCDSQCVIYTAYHTVIGHSDWLLYVCIVQTPSISITICDDFCCFCVFCHRKRDILL